MATTTTNYGLTKPDSTDFYDIDQFNANMDTIDAQLKENADNTTDAAAINTKEPTYTEADEVTALESGETIATAFGKLAKAVSAFITHKALKATSAVLGHVTLSDTYDSKVTGGAAANGLGASQNALYNCYDALKKNIANDVLLKKPIIGGQQVSYAGDVYLNIKDTVTNAKAQIAANEQGYSHFTAANSNDISIELSSESLNGSNGSGLIKLMQSSNVSKQFKFNEDGSFTTGNLLNINNNTKAQYLKINVNDDAYSASSGLKAFIDIGKDVDNCYRLMINKEGLSMSVINHGIETYLFANH